MTGKHKPKEIEPKDYGTVEISHRLTIIPKYSGPNTVTGKIVDETEIDRLLLREAINPRQHSTLEAFMHRLHKMGFIGLRSPDYEAPISADASAIGDRRAAMLRGMVKIFMRLDERVGPARRKALVDLCLKDAPWPEDNVALAEAIAKLETVLER